MTLSRMYREGTRALYLYPSAPLFLFLFVSAVLPVGLAFLRLTLLTLAAATGVASIALFRRPSIDRSVVWIVCLGVLGSLIATVHGVFVDNLGAVAVARVEVVWPMLFLAAVPAIQIIEDVGRLYRVLDLATVGVSLLTIATIGTGGQPFGEYTGALLGSLSLDADPTHLQLNLVSTLCLIFLLPYALNRILEQRRAGLRTTAWMYLSFVLAMIATVIGGQRSIYVGLAIGLVTAAFFSVWERRRDSSQMPEIGARSNTRSRVTTIFVASTIGLAAFCYVSGRDILSNFTSLLVSNRGDQIRLEQAQALWHEFMDAPVFGHGIGYVIPQYIRNVDFPWSYELLPLVILMTHGLVGSVLLFGSVGSMFVLLIRACGTVPPRFVVPVLAGSLSVLAGSLVNPVVTKLGTIWMLLLPLLIIQVARSSQIVGDETSVSGTVNLQWRHD